MHFFAVDDEPPIVNCIEDISTTIPLNVGGTTVSFLREPTATDNSRQVELASQTHASGDFFVTGTTTVTYVFRDPSGNTADCVFTVTVVEGTCPDIVWRSGSLFILDTQSVDKKL